MSFQYLNYYWAIIGAVNGTPIDICHLSDVSLITLYTKSKQLFRPAILPKQPASFWQPPIQCLPKVVSM